MAKIKKSDVSKIIAPIRDTVTAKIGPEDTEVEIKLWISPAEQAAFVAGVVHNITIDGVVYPALSEYIIKASKIEYFTNIPLPSSEKNACALIYGTNIIDLIDEFSPVANDVEAFARTQVQLAKQSSRNERDPINRIVDAIERLFDGLNDRVASVDLEQLMQVMGDGKALKNADVITALFGGEKHGTEDSSQ